MQYVKYYHIAPITYLKRITSMKALEENYNKKEENKVKFNVNLDTFLKKNN